MRSTLLLLSLAASLVAWPGCRPVRDPAPAPAPESSKENANRFAAALEEGDSAFARRGDPALLDVAIAAYGRAAAAHPGSPEAEIKLARAEAFAGLASEPAHSKEAWDSAARAGERALRTISPGWAAAIDAGEDPAAAAARVDAAGGEALYFVALGSMHVAQATGYAAVLAVKDPAMAMMARAAELDERLDAAGPHRALGAWRAALPVAAGGGAASSRAHFERCRVLAPDDLAFRVDEAETLAVLTQDSALFDHLLSEVADFDLTHNKAREPENAIAKKRAEALRTKKARLF